MTEQLMRYMIYVIVVEIWSHQNTPIVSEMCLNTIKASQDEGRFVSSWRLFPT